MKEIIEEALYNHKEFISVRLVNHSEDTWRTWKSLESHISGEAQERSLILSDIVYDDINYIKSCICQYPNPINLHNGIILMQKCAFKHGLHVEMVERQILDSKELRAIQGYKQRRANE